MMALFVGYINLPSHCLAPLPHLQGFTNGTGYQNLCDIMDDRLYSYWKEIRQLQKLDTARSLAEFWGEIGYRGNSPEEPTPWCLLPSPNAQFQSARKAYHEEWFQCERCFRWQSIDSKDRLITSTSTSGEGGADVSGYFCSQNPASADIPCVVPGSKKAVVAATDDAVHYDAIQEGAPITPRHLRHLDDVSPTEAEGTRVQSASHSTSTGITSNEGSSSSNNNNNSSGGGDDMLQDSGTNSRGSSSENHTAAADEPCPLDTYPGVAGAGSTQQQGHHHHHHQDLPTFETQQDNRVQHSTTASTTTAVAEEDSGGARGGGGDVRRHVTKTEGISRTGYLTSHRHFMCLSACALSPHLCLQALSRKIFMHSLYSIIALSLCPPHLSVSLPASLSLSFPSLPLYHSRTHSFCLSHSHVGFMFSCSRSV